MARLAFSVILTSLFIMAAISMLRNSHVNAVAPVYAGLNSSDFPNQAAAPAHLLADPSDPDHLDAEQ